MPPQDVVRPRLGPPAIIFYCLNAKIFRENRIWTYSCWKRFWKYWPQSCSLMPAVSFHLRAPPLLRSRPRYQSTRWGSLAFCRGIRCPRGSSLNLPGSSQSNDRIAASFCRSLPINSNQCRRISNWLLPRPSIADKLNWTHIFICCPGRHSTTSLCLHRTLWSCCLTASEVPCCSTCSMRWPDWRSHCRPEHHRYCLPAHLFGLHDYQVL